MRIAPLFEQQRWIRVQLGRKGIVIISAEDQNRSAAWRDGCLFLEHDFEIVQLLLCGVLVAKIELASE